jgi:hypothetical protein
MADMPQFTGFLLERVLIANVDVKWLWLPACGALRFDAVACIIHGVPDATQTPLSAFFQLIVDYLSDAGCSFLQPAAAAA